MRSRAFGVFESLFSENRDLSISIHL